MVTAVVAFAVASDVETVGSAVGFWIAAALVGLVLLLGASLRIVERHERAVVSRSGQVARVTGPGIVFRLPGLERVITVSTEPVDMPLVLTVSTRDGVSVHVMVAATCRVADPEASILVADPLAATALTIEGSLAREVARRNLIELLPAREQLETQLMDEVSSSASGWGTELIEVRIEEIEMRLTPRLLRAVHRL